MALDESISPADVTVTVHDVPFVYPRHLEHYIEEITIDVRPPEEGAGLFVRSSRFQNQC